MSLAVPDKPAIIRNSDESPIIEGTAGAPIEGEQVALFGFEFRNRHSDL